MHTAHTDWRWAAALLLGSALFAQWNTLGAALLLAGAAYLLLRVGYRAWRGGPLRNRHVKETYWRGRRIDLESRADGTWTLTARPPLQTVLCLALGTALAVVAIGMILAVASRG